MRKKNFTGPFWVVIVLGFLYVVSTVNVWVRGDVTGPWFVVLSLGWILVLAGEAILYWRIRGKNEAGKESWAHVIALTFIFLVPVFRGAMIEAFFGEVFGEEIGKQMLNYFSWQQTALYWTLVVIAHIFFSRVLWKAFVVKPATAVKEKEEVELPGGAVMIRMEEGPEDVLGDMGK